MTAITPTQRRLARHALGLPNARNRSYRNRFIATCCPGDYDHWMAMTEAGLADHGTLHTPAGFKHPVRRFWLTPEGAKAALEPGETLEPEDFPE
jgi:hypothetical protein